MACSEAVAAFCNCVWLAGHPTSMTVASARLASVAIRFMVTPLLRVVPCGAGYFVELAAATASAVASLAASLPAVCTCAGVECVLKSLDRNPRAAGTRDATYPCHVFGPL